MLRVPVLFLVFNRPAQTAQVWDAIRRVRPAQLFVVADGPRPNCPEDEAECAAVRRIIETTLDWPCDVKTLFRPTNLGCKESVSSGIAWFFEQVEEGIILEDDTLPVGSFFEYCSTLLERYRNESRIMHIGGNNFQFGRKRGTASFYFSRHAYIWGWATWRRAWENYNVGMTDFSEAEWEVQMQDWVRSPAERSFWKDIFASVRAGKIDTWDFQWTYAVLARRGISAFPNRNLVSNIGFGEKAMHTRDSRSRLSRLPTEEMGAIIFPKETRVDEDADDFVYQHLLANEPMPGLSLREKLANIRWELKHKWHAK